MAREQGLTIKSLLFVVRVRGLLLLLLLRWRLLRASSSPVDIAIGLHLHPSRVSDRRVAPQVPRTPKLPRRCGVLVRPVRLKRLRVHLRSVRVGCTTALVSGRELPVRSRIWGHHHHSSLLLERATTARHCTLLRLLLLHEKNCRLGPCSTTAPPSAATAAAAAKRRRLAR